MVALPIFCFFVSAFYFFVILPRALCSRLHFSRSAIAEMRYASTESKSLLRKLRCASENMIFKVRLLFCAFNGLISRCILLRCAF